MPLIIQTVQYSHLIILKHGSKNPDAKPLIVMDPENNNEEKHLDEDFRN